MDCGPPPEGFEERRSGYGGHVPVQRAFLHTYDLSLWPFDEMGEATLNTSTYTRLAMAVMPARDYGELFWWGQDVDVAGDFQTTAWRIVVSGGQRGDTIEALEARCGILDGSMCPWNLFIPPGGFVAIEAIATSGEPTVRGRVKGWRRAAPPEMG